MAVLSFLKMYRYRGGFDKYVHDKLEDIDNRVSVLEGDNDNALSTITIYGTDGYEALAGIRVALTDVNDSNRVYSTSINGTGSSGGATITNVPYGTYNVVVTAPEGYTVHESYEDFIVDAITKTLNVSVDAN